MSQLTLAGTLTGHAGHVTCLATTAANPNILLSGSRDKSVFVWDLSRHTETDFGRAHRSLRGHSHFVQDIAMSSDGNFAISASWDNTLRLWNLETGQTMHLFNGHTKDVMSVSFSPDNRQIVSSSRDNTIRLWNALGECKHIMGDGSHNQWVSCVRFSPNPLNPMIVSCGWDKLVKVWSMKDYKLKFNHFGHTGDVNCVTISPDGSLCASGGKDGIAMLWDLSDDSKALFSLDARVESERRTINALCFSPTRYWLCAATENCVRIFDLQEKTIVQELEPESLSGGRNECVSLAWSADGNILFTGYTDGVIRAWKVL